MTTRDKAITADGACTYNSINENYSGHIKSSMRTMKRYCKQIYDDITADDPSGVHKYLHEDFSHKGNLEKDFYEKTDKNIATINNIVNNVKEMRAIEDGKLELNVTDVKLIDAIDESLYMQSDKLKAKNIKITKVYV